MWPRPPTCPGRCRILTRPHRGGRAPCSDARHPYSRSSSSGPSAPRPARRSGVAASLRPRLLRLPDRLSRRPPVQAGDEPLPVKAVDEPIVVAAWAEPRRSPPGGGQAQILVRVARRGQRFSGVEVRLHTTEGSLYSADKVLATDASGMTRDRLTTRKTAVVTLNAGGTLYRFEVPGGGESAAGVRPPTPTVVFDLEQILSPDARPLAGDRPPRPLGRRLDLPARPRGRRAAARTSARCRALFAWARRRGRHLTFRAAGTSLSGQAVSDDVLVEIGPFFRAARCRRRRARLDAAGRRRRPPQPPARRRTGRASARTRRRSTPP